jgi:hypothetical protein
LFAEALKRAFAAEYRREAPPRSDG